MAMNSKCEKWMTTGVSYGNEGNTGIQDDDAKKKEKEKDKDKDKDKDREDKEKKKENAQPKERSPKSKEVPPPMPSPDPPSARAYSQQHDQHAHHPTNRSLQDGTWDKTLRSQSIGQKTLFSLFANSASASATAPSNQYSHHKQLHDDETTEFHLHEPSDLEKLRDLPSLAEMSGPGVSMTQKSKPVKKSSIYTRTGDKGVSSLLKEDVDHGTSRFPKHMPVYEALGSVDHASAQLGLCREYCLQVGRPDGQILLMTKDIDLENEKMGSVEGYDFQMTQVDVETSRWSLKPMMDVAQQLRQIQVNLLDLGTSVATIKADESDEEGTSSSSSEASSGENLAAGVGTSGGGGGGWDTSMSVSASASPASAKLSRNAGRTDTNPTKRSRMSIYRSFDSDGKQLQLLEHWIDHLDADLPPLKQFVLPGGGIVAAHLHIARSAVRRAERIVCSLTDAHSAETSVVKYLNRLSDYLFVAARTASYRLANGDSLR
eukprot:CAMPEP_0184691638 /NCGR_PEP_ID=MMETSP0313-20130426/422_1 /TAXON_ID=2792 /ORGANISM="Porphyridium aerugineum, Strain SAG 1380-2" /LENGTH=487 /DNA_ID=CAMNT_0027149389 /DNA_START=353 /DNA_END=1816 /DNA_ORIENTATION=+